MCVYLGQYAVNVSEEMPLPALLTPQTPAWILTPHLLSTPFPVVSSDSWPALL